MKRYLTIFATMAFLALSLTPAIALGQAPPPPADQNANPPQDQSANPSTDGGPGVGRASFVQGDVSSQRGDNAQWVALTANSPISPGDRVATGADGRAEFQLDYADILRLSANATANITSLARTGIQVQIGQGLVTYNVLRGSEATAEIDTPNAAIHPLGPGSYRIQVNSDSETVIIIRQGSADISVPQGSTHVDQGQMITIQGTDSPQYKTETAPGRDDWDTWNDDRNRRTTGAQSWRHTDRYYTGSEDLDNYGTWSEVPDYGPVWTPSGEGPDWAPYRVGRWVYEPYYGWTWVSGEPWGWAPYHYGRWFVYGGNWSWWPGPVVGYPGYYPIWSPAYVSFFGFGGGFGIGVGFGFGFGHFGWLPSGPGDWYHPWYGRWGGRYNAVGISNINSVHDGFGPLGGNRGGQFSNVHEALTNDRVRGGVSSMAGNEFGRGAVSAHQERMSAASFREGSAMSGKMPVTPSRESYSPSGRAGSASTIRSASSISQHFFNGGSRSFAGANNSTRGESGFGGNRGAGSTESVQSGRSGWQKFNPPSGAVNRSNQGFGAGDHADVNNSSRGGSGQAENRSSWQHFNPPTSTSRGGSSNSYNSYSRPPLNMRQPIVTPRGGSTNSDPYRGYNPSSRGGSPEYNAPRGPYGEQPRGNSGAPAYNAPRGGFNAPRGGSTAPRFSPPHYSTPHNSSGSHGSSGGHSSGGHGGGHK